MTEILLPCPFCGGKSFLYGAGAVFWIGCLKCRVNTPIFESEEKAIAAWNRRAEPENNPLTLDELRQMEGEPAFITPINLHEWICNPMDGKPEWGMVRKSWVRIWRSETADLTHTDFDFEDYGKTWLAYRHKPERSEI